MKGHHQGARRPAGQAQVDRVVNVWPDSLEIGPEGNRVLVGRELPAVAPPRAGKLVSPWRQRRLVQGGVQEQREPGVEALGDQPLKQSPRVRTDTAAGAPALQRPHVQQNPR